MGSEFSPNELNIRPELKQIGLCTVIKGYNFCIQIMIRFIVFLLVLGLIDVMAFIALRSLAAGWPIRLKYLAYAIHWSVPVVAVILTLLWMFTGIPETHKTAFTLLRAFVVIAYLSKFVIASFVLFDDIRRLLAHSVNYFFEDPPFDPGRSRFINKVGIMAGAVPFALLGYGIIRNPYRYKLHEVEVEVAGLPDDLDGFKIVQISDIHAGSFTFKDPVYNAIDMINAQQADIVAFTGDMVNNRADEMLPFVNMFEKIQSKYGVFSVLGNHDYGDYVRWPSSAEKMANMQQLHDINRQMGWNLLIDDHSIVEHGSAKVAIIGVGNIANRANFPTYGDLDKANPPMAQADFKILLSHDPSSWDKLVNNKHQDINLTLSGHTHGFQFGIEIPGVFRFSPSQFVYSQWAGLYKKGSQFLYVNRGLGFLGYPGRVGILPEVTSLILRRKTA